MVETIFAVIVSVIAVAGGLWGIWFELFAGERKDNSNSGK